MPLLDLKTNLTSLKFGRDRLNNGDSGQPYIQTPIIGDRYATQNAPQTLVDYANSNKNSLDYPIRGGGLDFQIGSQTLTISSKIDRQRIEKFLKDAPRGQAFINKQIGLQLSNPKTETGNTFTSAFNDVSAVPGVIENTRIYNYAKNTIAQVGVSGTGFHLPRAGLFPFDLTAKYYSDIVGRQNRMSSDEVQLENRLIILQQLKLRSSGQIVEKGTVLGAINKINQLGISLNRDVIQNYLGGPGSVYGVGNTIIRRFDDTSTAVRKTRSGAAMTYDAIMSQKVNENRKSNTSLTNRVITEEPSGAATFHDYPVQLDIQDFKSGDTGADFPSREIRYKMSNGYKAGDNISESDSIAQNAIKDYQNNAWTEESTAVDDMIKFGFECVNNDNPYFGIFLQFRAYLTSGITDNHQGTYNSFKYMGRGEDFFIYQGFSRTISFGFRVAVENPKDLLPLYKKLNALASQVYPDYSNSGVMRTSVTRVTVGDYLYRVPGFLESVNITIPQDSSWEINEGYQLPHYLDVQCTFKPIHSMLPKRVVSSDGPNELLYNYPIDENSTGPDQLNSDFYDNEPRRLTDAEIRKNKRLQKRQNNKATRQYNRDQKALEKNNPIAPRYF